MPSRPFEPSPPSDLTVPQPGSQTARAIFSMALRKLFEDLKGLRLPGLSDAARTDYRTLREVLVSFLPGRPGAVASLLRQPTVSAPLRCLLHRLPETERYVAELVGQSLFALHRSGLLPAGVTLAAPPAQLLSPRDDARLLCPGGPVELGRSPLPETGHYPPVTDHLLLALADNNPERLRDAHPDKAGNAIDLGGRRPAEWAAKIREALDLVGRAAPDVRREMDLSLSLAVPVGYQPDRHLSASYRQAIGTVYLTLHPDPVVIAEALVHEHSHTKLNALLELDPLLRNPWEARFESPYRPDPRPLMGVLLGAHAFVAVERLLEALGEPGFARHLDDLRQKNRRAVATLRDAAQPTPVGEGVLAELVALTAP